MSYLIPDADHKINADAFSLVELHRLYQDNVRGFNPATGQRNDFTEAKKYVLKYFYRVHGGYMINQNGKIENVSDTIAEKTYIKRFPVSNDKKTEKEFISWFCCSPDITIYRPVCVPNRQMIHGDTINTMAKTLHTKDKKYNKCSDKEKQAVNMMLDFIKQVWASNDNSQYEYLLNWFANMIQGNKNHTLLYVKSTTEGIGKSTLTDFIKEYVLGYGVCDQSTSYPLLSGNNTSLYGKMLVVFEELGKSTKAEWEKISSCLKEWITSDMIQYNQKYVAPFTSNNINNYIINTNCESLIGADGRRYFVCDLSTQYKNDFDFWKCLHDTCFNPEIGKAFYLYMMERDVSSFNSARMPDTKRKKEYIADLIKSPFKFIKFNYILTNKDLNCSVKEFYEYYQTYCEKTEQKQIYQKRPCIALLREIGIDYKTSNSKTTYNIDVKQLHNIATKYEWYSSDDQEELAENVIWKDYKTVKDMAVTNNMCLQAKDYEDEIQKLKQQILLLQQENADLKRAQQKPELTEHHIEYSSTQQKPKKEKPKKEKKPKTKSKSKKIKKEKKPKKEKKEAPKPKNKHQELFLSLLTDDEEE